MIELNNAFTLFISLWIEALPFLLLGIIVSSGLFVFVDKRQLVAYLPRNAILGALVGSCLGLVLPVFQYGNVPVARRLLLQGVPVSVAISFLLAAPTINPIVIWLTWKAFPEHLNLVFLRIILTLIIAVVIGCIFSTYRKRQAKEVEADSSVSSENIGDSAYKTRDNNLHSGLLKSGTFFLTKNNGQTLQRSGNLIYGYKTVSTSKQSLAKQLSLWLDNTCRELVELGLILLVGCAIAAIIQVIIPQVQVLNLGKTSASAIVALMLLAIIISLGSTTDALFVSTLTSQFNIGSLLVFMLLGSIIDLKQLSLLLSTFRFKAVIYLLILTCQLTFMLTLFIDFYTG